MLLVMDFLLCTIWLYTYDREAGNGGVNRGHYSNAQVDALIDQAFTEMDDTKRGELVAELTRSQEKIMHTFRFTLSRIHMRSRIL